MLRGKTPRTIAICNSADFVSQRCALSAPTGERMRQILAVSHLAPLLAILLAACPPTYPKCTSDENCAEHREVCVQGQCRECATDQNCKTGFVCQQNKCMPKPATAAVSQPEPAVGPKSCSTDADCPEKQLCVRSACVDISSNLAECGFVRVHFDFNSVDLKPEDRGTLDRMARCVRADAKMHVTIEGNADERGTEEYNLQLSQRRAAAVQRYLQTMGASNEQLDTVGYGEEKPLCKEHDEACWAKNRRAGIKPKGAK
jgi:peptidoglycan-associated lipoprotein